MIISFLFPKIDFKHVTGFRLLYPFSDFECRFSRVSWFRLSFYAFRFEYCNCRFRLFHPIHQHQLLSRYIRVLRLNQPIG